jgi:hypothetical protein
MKMLRRLRLTEFATEPGVAPATNATLRGDDPGLRIEPTLGAEGRYNLTPDQRVGLISLPTLVIEIRPKVPITSVLFLVSWACDAVFWFDEQQPDFAHDLDVVEMLAIMLARTTERATRRGLLNGYQVEEEPLPAPRGRILFDEQIRRRLWAPPIGSATMSLLHILENRLLPLTAVARPAEIAGAEARSHTSPTPSAVKRLHFPIRGPDVVFTRQIRHYQPAISLASLLLRSASLELGAGGTRAPRSSST